MWTKGLVIGIILLFVGASVVLFSNLIESLSSSKVFKIEEKISHSFSSSLFSDGPSASFINQCYLAHETIKHHITISSSTKKEEERNP